MGYMVAVEPVPARTTINRTTINWCTGTDADGRTTEDWTRQNLIDYTSSAAPETMSLQHS